jgi:hypothetical protein
VLIETNGTPSLYITSRNFQPAAQQALCAGVNKLQNAISGDLLNVRSVIMTPVVVLLVESNTKLAAKAMEIQQERELTFKVCIPMKVSAKTALVYKKTM